MFVFWGANGDDTVVGFTDGEDLIDLSAHDGGTIMLRNFDIADLDAGDFLF